MNIIEALSGTYTEPFEVDENFVMKIMIEGQTKLVRPVDFRMNCVNIPLRPGDIDLIYDDDKKEGFVHKVDTVTKMYYPPSSKFTLLSGEEVSVLGYGPIKIYKDLVHVTVYCKLTDPSKTLFETIPNKQILDKVLVELNKILLSNEELKRLLPRYSSKWVFHNNDDIERDICFKGVIESFEDLPKDPLNGDMYLLKHGATFTHDTCSPLITGETNKFFIPSETEDNKYTFNFDNEEYTDLLNYFANISDDNDELQSYLYTSQGEEIAIINTTSFTIESFDSLITDKDSGIISFYLCPEQTMFYTVGDLSCVFSQNNKWYPFSDMGYLQTSLTNMFTEINNLKQDFDNIVFIDGGNSYHTYDE